MARMEEILTPSWLDESFLGLVLQSVEDMSKKVAVLKWGCHYAVPPGTNYLSQLYRLKVEYKIGDDNSPRSRSLIIKTPIESGQIREFMDTIGGYEKELKIYSEVIPRMYELTDLRITARSYVCPLHNSLVLEDLREQGYKMGDRLKQLDAEHCRQFFTTIAKFHGFSVAVNQQNPVLIEAAGKNNLMHSDDGKEKEKMFTKFNLTAMLQTVKMLGYDQYAEMIESRLDTYHSTMEKVVETSKGPKVLNHGDCWTSNILFKYNDAGKVIDAKLVDFQMTRYVSFAHDILYFWFTSANHEVRENLQGEMFEVYRQALNQTLEEVQSTERLSKEDINSAIRHYALYVLLVVSSLLSVAMADPDDILDYNSMSEDEFSKPVTEDSHITKNYRSKHYKAILPDVLRQMEELGVFTE